MKAIKFVVAFSFLAASSQAETLSEALVKCSEQSNSLKRLVCYDRITKNMKQYKGLQQDITQSLPAPAPVTSVATPPPPPQPPAATKQLTMEQTFGNENKASEERLDKIVAGVSEVSKDARKRLIITLDNGQIWRQAEGSGISVKAGQTVYVERGALGSFHMSKDGINRRMRVKRIDED